MTWAHSSSNGTTLTVSPFFHFNRADYIGGPGDTPFILSDNRRSSYVGVLANLTVPFKKNRFQGGLEAWGQHDNTFFGLAANPGTKLLQQDFRPWGNDEALFFGDRYQVSPWLTLNGGLRLTHYGGLASENAADPRLGAAVHVPRLHWVLHGYYSDYFQPPPLDTIAGPLLNFAVNQGFGFIPLPGERDKQWDVGLSIPWRRWFLNVDHFRTSANNFLDHDEVGNSDIFLPLADLAALISGTEVSLRSPEILNRASLNVVYSNQIAKGLGPISGGLIEFAPTSYFYLDHDQRNTVNTVLQFRLPRRAWASAVYSFGSGFLNGDGPAHLPPHSTVGLALGKDFGEALSLSLNAINLTNAHFLLDTSNTFGGTHVVDPREVYVQATWRFDY
jgi:outer membrane receptor protein involved in Fe transport